VRREETVEGGVYWEEGIYLLEALPVMTSKADNRRSPPLKYKTKAWEF
jgi:hypothetical protein